MEHRPFRLLLIVAIPVFFLYLGANSIWDANEAFYVETPRQMVLTGDYVTPMFNGDVRLNKPVLSYWIVAGLYKAFGTSVTVERIGIACGAMGLILAAFVLGRALRSTSTGALAALIVATSPRVVLWSRRIFIDVYIAMFMALALACFVLAERQPQHRRRWLLLMYVAIGLGVLTKGPIAIAIPAAVFAVWMTLERRWSDLGRVMLLPGLAIVVAIVAPWYVADYFRHGWTYISQFFLGENLGRFATRMTGSARPPYFYLGVLLTDLFPWAPLVIVPLLTAWRGRSASSSDESDDTSRAMRRLLWCWIVVIVAVFSLSKSKEDLYIFPVVPAVAALIADALVGTAFGARSAAVRAMLAVVGTLCVIIGVAIAWLLQAGVYAIPSAIAIGVLVVVTGGTTAILALTHRGVTAAVSLAAGFVLFNYALVVNVLPALEADKPIPPLAQIIRAHQTPEMHVGFYNMSLPSLVYYVDRTVTEIDSLDQARDFFLRAEPAYALMTPQDYDAVHALVPSTCMVGHTTLFPFDNLKLSALLHNEAAPEVWLVANRCASIGGR